MQDSVTLVKKMKKVHLCILVYFYTSKLILNASVQFLVIGSNHL